MKILLHCEECQLGVLPKNRTLFCPACGKDIHDFSSPRLRSSLLRKFRWEENSDVRWRLYLDDHVLALVMRDSWVLPTPDNSIETVYGAAHYRLVDQPLLRALDLYAADMEYEFKTMEMARAALMRFLEFRLRETA